MEDLRHTLEYLMAVLRECPDPRLGEWLAHITQGLYEFNGFDRALTFVEDVVLVEGGKQEMVIRVMQYLEDTMKDLQEDLEGYGN